MNKPEMLLKKAKPFKPVATQKIKEVDENYKPSIVIEEGKDDYSARQIDKLLTETGNIFKRAKRVVYVSKYKSNFQELELPENTVGISVADGDWLRMHIHKIADVFRIKKGERVLTSMKKDLANKYLRKEEWKLPEITGVSCTPLIRKNGELFYENGYDKRTGRFIDWEEGALDVPDKPTQHRALEAYNTLMELLKEFRFKTDLDKHIALAAIMSGVLRQSLRLCPAFAFTSPSPASGKSLLGRLIGILASGATPMPVTTGHDGTEFEKRISSALLSGSPVVLFDNLNQQGLNSDSLGVAITDGKQYIRKFGELEPTPVKCSSLYLINGNNLYLADDMLRRVFLCELDPQEEHPENIKYEGDPVKEAFKRRKELVSAVFTLVKACRISDTKRHQKITLADFSDFTLMVRDPILWITEGKFDVVQKMKDAKAINPKREAEYELLQHWHDKCGGDYIKAADVIKKAQPYRDGFGLQEPAPELWSAIEEVTPTGKPNSRSLGRWCQRNKGRIINGYKLESNVHTGVDARRGLSWRVVKDEAIARDSANEF